jgi:hypothetical protein
VRLSGQGTRDTGHSGIGSTGRRIIHSLWGCQSLTGWR